jgi:hypothetical protein
LVIRWWCMLIVLLVWLWAETKVDNLNDFQLCIGIIKARVNDPTIGLWMLVLIYL